MAAGVFLMQQGGKNRTARQQNWMDEVRALHCLECSMPAEIHHSLGETAAVKIEYVTTNIGHEWIIPLCASHHTGISGVHKMGKNRKPREKQYFEIVIARLSDSPNLPPTEVIDAIRGYHR
jgi:hypothetical protein